MRVLVTDGARGTESPRRNQRAGKNRRMSWQNGEFTIHSYTVHITVEKNTSQRQDDRTLTATAQTVLGDGDERDEWLPYVTVLGGGVSDVSCMNK